MHTQIMTFYRTCDAYWHNKGFRDDPQARMTTVEVMLTALVGAFFFANNLRVAQQALKESGVVPYMLSESRFNRRWHKITTEDWQDILTFLAEQYPQDTCIVDSCPFPVCHNRRAYRSPIGGVLSASWLGQAHSGTRRQERQRGIEGERVNVYAAKRASDDHRNWFLPQGREETTSRHCLTMLAIRLPCEAAVRSHQRGAGLHWLPCVCSEVPLFCT